METRNNYREAMDSALEKLQRLIEMRQQAGPHKVDPRHDLQLRGDFDGDGVSRFRGRGGDP